MSVTSLIGGVAVGLQSAKGTTQPTLHYFPSTSVDLNFQQDESPYPFEVGGELFQRGSYKGSVMASGGINMLARPEPLGYILKALTGHVSSVDNTDGTFTHTFTFNRTPVGAWGGDGLTPWLTLMKNLSGLMAERYDDARLGSLRIAMPSANLVTASTSWIAAQPVEVPVPASMAVDTGQALQTCTGIVMLDGHGRTDGNATLAGNAKPSNISVAFGNNLTSDEFSVGSYYLDDITLLSQSASIGYDLIVRNRDLWAKVYRYGAAQPSAGTTGAWSPTIYRAALDLAFLTPANLKDPSTHADLGRPGRLEIAFPAMDYQAFPTGLAGNQLVRSSLSAQYTMGTEGLPTISLVNTTAGYAD